MQLAEYFKKIGIDLDLTVEAWKKQQGVSRWKNYSDVICLPEVELYPNCHVKFHFSLDEISDLPVEYFLATVFDGKDNRATYNKVKTGLTEVLGEPKDTSASNTLSHSWGNAELQLLITTWPPELNKEFSNNAVTAVDPNYSYETHISIIQKTATKKISDDMLKELLKDSKTISLGDVKSSFVDSFPQHLYRLIFWQNPSVQSMPEKFFFGEKLGYIGPRFSLVLDKAQIRALNLVRILPARSSGYSYVEVVLQGEYNKDHKFKILSALKPKDCDIFAKELAAYWSLPLSEQEYLDD
jgi:hypothetical protein